MQKGLRQCAGPSVQGVQSKNAEQLRPWKHSAAPQRPGTSLRGSMGFDTSPCTPRAVRSDRDPAQWTTWAKSVLKHPHALMESAPRVRVRTEEMRKAEKLIELAVVNERLRGELEPWEVRNRLEHIRLFKTNWPAVYEHVVRSEVHPTLAAIEEACIQVDKVLSEEERDRSSIATLKKELESLQSEMDVAHEKLHKTQERVEQSLQRVDRMKAEMAALERMQESSTTGEPQFERKSSSRKPVRTKDRGLKSSTTIEPALKNFWYPTAFSSSLKKDVMIPFELCDEPWVLFRDENGAPACIKDQCAHRACPLSAGKVENGQVACPYHGWKFNGDGACTEMPSTRFCQGVGVPALPCYEKDGFVWVWPGGGPPDANIPDSTAPPPGFDIHAEIMVEVPVEHGLLVENLLDLAHAPFTHTSTFARGWPIPDVVKFHASKMLSGSWDPYPIDMAFHPPCMTESMIGLAQPGKIVRGATAASCTKHLHQVHVCLPSRKGHTRLLYRMSLDFMGWLRYVPFIEQVWKAVAAQVLGEDMVLVTGQQDRLERGGDTWANPMAYDKLAVRYRRWRNSTAEGNLEASRKYASGAKMSAGMMFLLQEEEEEVNEDTECRI